MPQLFQSAVITSAGLRLLTKAQSGNAKIEFTRVETGNGSYTKEEKDAAVLMEMTGLKSVKNSYGLSDLRIHSDHCVKVSALIANYDSAAQESLITEGYYLNEIGLYARENDEEVLYSIAVTSGENGDFMPPYNGLCPVEIVQEYYVTVSNSAEVTIQGSTGAVALAEDLLELREESNNVYMRANSAYNAANNAYNQANNAYTQANSAYTKANNAYNAANNAAAKLKGTVVAIGGFANANGNYSTALGYYAKASGNDSTALGSYASANTINSTALGSSANASGNYSTALGDRTNANGSYSTALGYAAKANGNYSTALGSSANASGINSTALGYLASANTINSTALGSYSIAKGNYSIAIGDSANASGNYSIAIGNFASASGNYSTALGDCAKVDTTKSYTIQLGNASSLSELSCRVALTVTSDERDKTDITGIENGAVEFLKKVTAIRYKLNHRELYIDEENLSDEERLKKDKFGLCEYDREAHAKGTKKGSRIRVGVSAQETQKALEEVYGSASYANLINDNLFDFSPDEIPEGVENQLSANYEGFIPFLIKAVQELAARLEHVEIQKKGGEAE